MRNLRLFLPLVMLLFVPLSAYSQGELSAQSGNYDLVIEDYSYTDLNSIEGSPYLSNDFFNGKITLYNGRQSATFPIRFNLFENIVEYESEDEIYGIPANRISEFTMGDRTFKRGFNASRLDESDFLEVLIIDNIELYAKYGISLKRSVSTYGSQPRVTGYDTPSTTFYLKVPEGDMERLSTRRRSVFRNIDHFENEMREFYDNNNIDFSERDDVVQFFSHYNSLLEQR